jgi:hypothetical protein
MKDASVADVGMMVRIVVFYAMQASFIAYVGGGSAAPQVPILVKPRRS